MQYTSSRVHIISIHVMIGDHGVSDAKDSIAKCSEVSEGASYDGEYGDPSM